MEIVLVDGHEAKCVCIGMHDLCPKGREYLFLECDNSSFFVL